jgi:hypothetical protein
MKRSVVLVLLSYSVLGLTATPVPAQEASPERKSLVVEPRNDFRAALEKGVRLKATGQPITARLLEPVYAGEDLAQAPRSRDMFPRSPQLRCASVPAGSWLATLLRLRLRT